MGINLQHEDGNRKVHDELVEALVSALLSEVPVLANFHASYVEAFLKDLRQIRDGEQSGELRERVSKLTIQDKDKRDHVVTLTDLSKSLELPVGNRGGGGLSKQEHVEQILTALVAEVPATASVDDAKVDDAKTALVDASLRELLALRDGLAGQAAQRQELESRLDQFNVRDRSSDVVTLIDLCKSLGVATKQQGRYMSGGVLKRQIVEFLLRGSLDAAKKASVDATLQELRRVRDGVEEHAARRGKLEGCLKYVKFQHQASDVVVLQDLCRALELPIAKSDGGGLKRPELVEQIVVSLLAEVKAALVDKTLEELRRVRDGVKEHAARRGKLEKRLSHIGFKRQGPDVVVLQDLCPALELPIANARGLLKRSELEQQIVSTLMAEVVVPCSHVGQSCFGLAMELCRLFDGSQWDVDAAARQVCDTVARCVCVGAVLTGNWGRGFVGETSRFWVLGWATCATFTWIFAIYTDAPWFAAIGCP